MAGTVMTAEACGVVVGVLHTLVTAEPHDILLTLAPAVTVITWPQVLTTLCVKYRDSRTTAVTHWNNGNQSDIMTWKYFQHYWPFVKGIHQLLVDSLHKGPVMHSFNVFFVMNQKKLINSWVSSDLRYHNISLRIVTISQIHTTQYIPRIMHKVHVLLCFVVLWYQGAISIRKTVLPGMAIPMLKIRRPNGRLIFNMEITIRR